MKPHTWKHLCWTAGMLCRAPYHAVVVAAWAILAAVGYIWRAGR